MRRASGLARYVCQCLDYSTALVPRGFFLVELAEREAKHKAPMKTKRNMRTLMEPPFMATPPHAKSIAAWGVGNIAGP